MIDSNTMDRRRFLAGLAAAVLVGPDLVRGSTGMTALQSKSWKAVQMMLDGYVQDKKVAGAAVALSYGGTAITYRASGSIALDSPVRFDENSLCRIYSMTKPVTGIAAMMLVEDGRIKLDQPVADVLPEFRSLRVATDFQKGLESRAAVGTMTMRHLLTHTAGFSYWTPETPPSVLRNAYRERGITPGNYYGHLTRSGFGPQAIGLADMVKRVAELPLAYEPGTSWQYSIGLDVMGAVIESVTGKGLDVFLKERLFDPLRMDSTGFQVAANNGKRLTTNYTVTPGGLQPRDPAASSVWLKPPTLLAGAAGLVSTARDFARFGEMLLGDGTLGRVRIMKPETALLARTNLLPAGVTSPRGGYGAGAPVVLPGVPNIVGPPGTMVHGGAAGTLWWIDPARQGNMVFMTQFMPPTSYPARDDIAAAIETDLKR